MSGITKPFEFGYKDWRGQKGPKQICKSDSWIQSKKQEFFYFIILHLAYALV